MKNQICIVLIVALIFAVATAWAFDCPPVKIMKRAGRQEYKVVTQRLAEVPVYKFADRPAVMEPVCFSTDHPASGYYSADEAQKVYQRFKNKQSEWEQVRP